MTVTRRSVRTHGDAAGGSPAYDRRPRHTHKSGALHRSELVEPLSVCHRCSGKRWQDVAACGPAVGSCRGSGCEGAADGGTASSLIGTDPIQPDLGSCRGFTAGRHRPGCPSTISPSSSGRQTVSSSTALAVSGVARVSIGSTSSTARSSTSRWRARWLGCGRCPPALFRFTGRWR